MKKAKKIFYFKWLVLIIWMAVIFNFSNEPAIISDKKSGSILILFNSLGLDLNNIFGTLANFIVRKIGHFTEFFILYVFLYNVLKESFSKKIALIIALVYTFLYACSDEFHQIFVPGREGRFRDVLIDTCGGIAALIYFYCKKDNKIMD